MAGKRELRWKFCGCANPALYGLLPCTCYQEVKNMSVIATSIPTPPTTDIGASAFSSQFTNDVVEIGLLLPTNWANTLIEISKQRRQSVAQVLRAIIGNALHDCASGV